RVDMAAASSQLRGKVLPALSGLLGNIGEAPLAQQRLSAQIGGDRTFRDLASVEAAFGAAPWVTEVLRQMPSRLTRRDLEDNLGAIGPIDVALLSPRGDAAW